MANTARGEPERPDGRTQGGAGEVGGEGEKELKQRKIIKMILFTDAADKIS